MFLSCLSRCQDRGVLNFVTVLFDAVNDSFGEPWTDNDVQEVSPGESLLTLIQRFSEAYGWEFRMLQGFRLQVVQGDLGVDRSNFVRFWLGGHQITHSLNRTSRDLVTNVWAQTDGNFIASANGSSSATNLLREDWVDGFAGGDSAASVVANSTLNHRVNPAKQRSLKVPYNPATGLHLFDDFTYCDWIGVEDDTTINRVKIESVAWKTNPDSSVDLEMTFSGE